MMRKFVKQSVVMAPVEKVFAFHDRPEAIIDLTPPWAGMTLVQPATNGLQIGSRVILKVKMGPFTKTWVAEHTEYELNRMFADVQREGPFSYWYHRHLFEGKSDNSTLMTDEIEYKLPMGSLGDLCGHGIVENQLRRSFDYRHRIVADKMKLLLS